MPSRERDAALAWLEEAADDLDRLAAAFYDAVIASIGRGADHEGVDHGDTGNGRRRGGGRGGLLRERGRLAVVGREPMGRCSRVRRTTPVTPEARSHGRYVTPGRRQDSTELRTWPRTRATCRRRHVRGFEEQTHAKLVALACET